MSSGRREIVGGETNSCKGEYEMEAGVEYAWDGSSVENCVVKLDDVSEGGMASSLSTV